MGLECLWRCNSLPARDPSCALLEDKFPSGSLRFRGHTSFSRRYFLIRMALQEPPRLRRNHARLSSPLMVTSAHLRMRDSARMVNDMSGMSYIGELLTLPFQ